MIYATLLCSLLSLQQAPDLAKPITYDANALSVRQVMADLSQLSGVNLHARNEVQNEHLVLHFDKAPLGVVLEKLAYLTFGAWEKTDKGYDLNTSNAALNANAAEVHANALKQIEKAMGKMRKRLTDKPNFTSQSAEQLAKTMASSQRTTGANMDYTPNYMSMMKLQREAPMGRAMDKVMLSLPPDFLANIPPMSKVVLANDPTSMQYAIPESGLAAINSLISEQQIWSQATSKYLSKSQNPFDFATSVIQNLRPASRVLITLMRYTSNIGVMAQMTIADSSGKIIAQDMGGAGGSFLGDDEVMNSFMDMADPSKSPALPPIELSKTAEAFCRLSSSENYRGQKGLRVTPSMAEMMVHPTTYDPFSLWMGEGMIAMAKAHHENLGVLVDDEVLTYSSIFASEGKFNQAMIRKPIAFLPEKITIADNWFLSRPTDYHEHVANRIDRSSLEAFLTDAYANRCPSLELLADFALKSPGQFAAMYASTYASVIPSLQSFGMAMGNWDGLRFYGSLNEDQRKPFQRLAVSQLDETQKSLIHELVYGLNSRLDFEDTPMPDVPSGPVQAVTTTGEAVTSDVTGGQDNDVGMADGAMYMGTLKSEPTEALPNGIPHNSVCQIKENRKMVILAKVSYNGGFEMEQPMGPEELAWMVYQAKHPQPNGGMTLKSLQPASQRELTITLNFAPKITQTIVLTSAKPQGDIVTDYHKLPTELVGDIDKQVAEIEKNNAGEMPMQAAPAPIVTGTNGEKP